jgi:hypothetical protein
VIFDDFRVKAREIDEGILDHLAINPAAPPQEGGWFVLFVVYCLNEHDRFLSGERIENYLRIVNGYSIK